ncbi:MAG: hypothetical protein AAGJ93_04605, partial [Bacteroidota bacterium]
LANSSTKDQNFSTMQTLLRLSKGSYSFFDQNSNTLLSINHNALSFYNNFKVKSDGYLYARQIEVIGSGNFPDYVFEDDYNLRPLAEVEAFIQQNHHLPEVPSAEEVTRDGHNLGEMNEILLKKVEELTLYLIDLEKRNKALQERVEKLEQQ